MEPSCLQDFHEIRAALDRREELLRNKDVPLQSELYRSLGPDLGKIVIDNMNSLSKELMGATDPLKGPPKNLWIPPTTRLNNNVFFLPPSPTDINKGFLHQGILEIGGELEGKIEQNCRERIKKATNETSEFERFECERRLNFTIDCENRRHAQELKNLKEEYEAALYHQLNEFHSEYIKSRGDYILRFRCFCEEMIDRSKDQQTQTEFEETKPHQEYNKELQKKYELTMNRSLRGLWEQFKEHLRIQRHILTCSHITEHMHVVCAQKMEAKRKIEQVRKLCNEELNRIAGKSGYALIKDKYIVLMQNLKTFMELTIKNQPEHKEFLQQFQREIERDIRNIEFEENLCECCQEAKNLQRTSAAIPSSNIKSPAGLLIFSKKDGQQNFCTCNSTSEDELNEFKDKLEGKLPPKELANAEWYTASSESDAFPPSNKSLTTDKSGSTSAPVNSDLAIAKEIATMINIDEILINAFDKIKLGGIHFASMSIIQQKLVDSVRHEIKEHFNHNTIMEVISKISKRNQSFILGARDSLELVKARRSTIRTEASNEIIHANHHGNHCLSMPDVFSSDSSDSSGSGTSSDSPSTISNSSCNSETFSSTKTTTSSTCETAKKSKDSSVDDQIKSPIGSEELGECYSLQPAVEENQSDEKEEKRSSSTRKASENPDGQPPEAEFRQNVFRVSDRFDNEEGDVLYEEDKNLKSSTEPINAIQFWESRIKTPLYMIPPGSRVDPCWIYHKSTNDEWNKLFAKYQKPASICGSSGSCSCEEETISHTALRSSLKAYREHVEHKTPVGKMRIRSLIDLLERNEEVSKVLYMHKNRDSKSQ